MINELYELSKTLKNEKIQTHDWHAKYISGAAPDTCITISDGKVINISSIDKQIGSILRKYGSNHGSFPCMNFAPLYRIIDDQTKKTLSELIKNPESLDDEMLRRIKSWCVQNNWGKNFQDQYKRSMVSRPAELRSLAAKYKPIQILIDESQYFTDFVYMRAELEKVVWNMLERRKDITLALKILFDKTTEKNGYGKITVALESPKLLEIGTPAISEKFVLEFNRHLIDATEKSQKKEYSDTIDAFGIPFININEPMPKVKMPSLKEVILRTMNKDIPCLHRYGQKGCLTFPASIETRKTLQQALDYISKKELEGKTWICIDKLKGKPRDILFAYPLELSHIPNELAACFKKIDNNNSFDESAKKLLSEIKDPRNSENDSYAQNINIFIIRRLNIDNNSGKTKVIYTRQTDAYELEKCSEAWTAGCKNLPKFPFGAPRVLYPLEAADVLNTFWKQNGEKASDSFKPTPKYHGLELLLEPDLPVTADLHVLSEKAMTLGAFLGKLYATEEYQDKSSETKKFCSPKWNDTKDILALIGFLLYRKNIRKDDYMENLPYLYGQLFKACDELHALYCKVVRNGDIPPQLAGGSLFQSAAEMPVRTLNVLQQRIMPYYLWAKSYRLKDIQEPGKESWRAAWLYHLCERIMTKLENNWNTQTRFNDEEKAQLFIGYLAAFSKKEQGEMNSEEETTNG